MPTLSIKWLVLSVGPLFCDEVTSGKIWHAVYCHSCKHTSPTWLCSWGTTGHPSYCQRPYIHECSTVCVTFSSWMLTLSSLYHKINTFLKHPACLSSASTCHSWLQCVTKDPTPVTFGVGYVLGIAKLSCDLTYVSGSLNLYTNGPTCDVIKY